MTEITPALLLKAYAAGVFPMADSAADTELFWIDPDPRGILPLDAVHIPQRLQRSLRTSPLRIRCDTAFEQVMRHCAETRPQTWINAEILSLYTALHKLGYAHSVEAWAGDELVGGLYGVAIGGLFCGESMFSRTRDASKIALIHLAAILIEGGFVLLDTQFVTDHLRQFGAIEIPRAEYHRRLREALTAPARFHGVTVFDPIPVLQSRTQTS